MNYCGTGRSNQFKVKDPKAFLEWAGAFHGCTVHPAGDDTFWVEGGCESGDFPMEQEDGTEVEFVSAVAPFLADDEVAVFVHAGNEGMRYISGYAFAINNKGESRTVALGSIYEQAAELTKGLVAKAEW